MAASTHETDDSVSIMLQERLAGVSFNRSSTNGCCNQFLLENGILTVLHVVSQDNLADIKTFQYLLNQIMGIERVMAEMGC